MNKNMFICLFITIKTAYPQRKLHGFSAKLEWGKGLSSNFGRVKGLESSQIILKPLILFILNNCAEPIHFLDKTNNFLQAPLSRIIK